MTWTPPEEIILNETDDVFMALHVIYRSPKDYPGKWVVRKQYVIRGQDPNAHPKVDREPQAICATLKEARDSLPRHLVCIGRMPHDDPVIYEVWV